MGYGHICAHTFAVLSSNIDAHYPGAFCRVPGEDGRIFVISDEELQGWEVDARRETLREAVRTYYPGWADYTQRVVTPHYQEEVDADLARLMFGFPIEEVSDVNPWVLLTVLVLRYGETPPLHFDAWGIANDPYAQILYSDVPESWGDRFASKGSYRDLKSLLGVGRVMNQR